MADNDPLAGLRAQAQNLIAANALGLGGGAPLSLEDRAKRPWDLPAKFAAAQQIFDEESRRARVLAGPGGSAHNNAIDAMRHARASQRLADEAGPGLAALVGVGHEFVDSLPRFVPGGHWQPTSEALMDLRNNAVGLRAAREGVPIDPSKLQTRPVGLMATMAQDTQDYSDTSPGYPSQPSPADAPRYDPQTAYPPYR